MASARCLSVGETQASGRAGCINNRIGRAASYRGVNITLDSARVNVSDKYLWKGVLIQDIPNTAFLLGYMNASWTLGAEASMQLVCRIIRYMMPRGLAVVAPRVEDERKLRPMGMMNLKSTYILAAKGILPKC